MVFQPGNTLGVADNILERNAEAAQSQRLRIDRFKFLVQVEGLSPRKAKDQIIEEFQLKRNPKAGTPSWMKKGKEELIAEGFDYKESPRGPENVGGRRTAQDKRNQILENFDERLKRTKQKTGFGKQYELAHTANIFQAKKLGIDYPIDALALQTQNINNKVAENLNDELKPLYRKQLKLVNKLKRKNTPSLQNQLDKTNFQISETVATGGKQGSVAANVLKPIIVDPQTLKGSILDLGFDTSSEIIATPGATTKVTAGSPDDLFARANIESRLKNVRSQFENNTDNVCSIFGRSRRADGGMGCVAQFDEAVQKNPQGLFQKVLNFAKSPGVKRFSLASAAGAAGAAIVKEFRNDDPTSYLSNEDQQKNMLVAMATDPIMDPLANQFDKPDILDYQLPALGAAAATSTALGAPSTIKASRTRGMGMEKKGLAKTGLRVLGKGLGIMSTPGALAPFAAADIASQVYEGDSATDIATNPFNYLYGTFADQTDKMTRGLKPTLRKVARLGMSPGALRVMSRAGLVGLAGSLGIQGYNLLTDD